MTDDEQPISGQGLAIALDCICTFPYFLVAGSTKVARGQLKLALCQVYAACCSCNRTALLVAIVCRVCRTGSCPVMLPAAGALTHRGCSPRFMLCPLLLHPLQATPLVLAAQQQAGYFTPSHLGRTREARASACAKRLSWEDGTPATKVVSKAQLRSPLAGSKPRALVA
jgi:hypothetical protein